MIYLSAEVVSGLGEDTFWTWFKREFPSSSFGTPKHLNDEDIVLRYSTLGFLPIQGKQVALCWELYPDMKELFRTDQWDSTLERVYQTARYSTYRTVATDYTKKYYQKFGSVETIPIGVNTDLFRPIKNKKALRKKYGIPLFQKIGIWMGTVHPMKGYANLLQYSEDNPDIHWIIIWKTPREAGHMPGANNFTQVSQKVLAELFNCADFYLVSGLLRPFFMVEWEAMACNLPMVILNKKSKEFVPSSNPRDDILRMGWDRKSVKKTWEQFLLERGIKW
ncbi:MAG: hypothetical protein OEV37_03970 [Candidatus Berkelbacteria bacterium]|nr:hypothetical protein [Candidatus Berkelbacteria bacterium]